MQRDIASVSQTARRNTNHMTECSDCEYIYYDDQWKRRCEYIDDDGRCPFEPTPGEE